jgi:DNA transposition AAA+ family ATPase
MLRPPGGGKTLSARRYANWNQIEAYAPYSFASDAKLAALLGSQTVFYTPAVVNSPGRIAQDIHLRRHHLRPLALAVVFQEQAAARQARALIQRIRRAKGGQASAAASDTAKSDAHRREETTAPTSLIIIDETDRLKTASLEQVRDIFDGGEWKPQGRVW